ncbi:NUDIX hydrolase [Streptomyces sp. NPDC020875]|uniref:NUDIX hydrolase n=1 Tax=Streptomyces sp. NPDC020875 TaxID=3154898 RepID=UPI0033C59973
MTASEHPPAVALAVVSRDRHVLLVRRRVPEGPLRRQFPGGAILPGEPAEAAAVRETGEETGISVAPGSRRSPVLGSRIHQDTGRRIVYVACDFLGGQPCVAAPAEVDAARWIPHDDLTKYIPQGVYGPALEHLRARERPPVDLADVIADAALAQELAATRPTGETADALRRRLQHHIRTHVDAVERYGRSLVEARYRDLVLKSAGHARQLLDSGEKDPAAGLHLLGMAARSLATYAATASAR